MKYTIYYKGDKVKLFNGDYNYVVNMYKEANSSSSCLVSTGGDIVLSNKDILHINEQNGELDYEQGATGIGFSLESGHEVLAFLTVWSRGAHASVNNCFFDIQRLYQDKNILNLYEVPSQEVYNHGRFQWQEWNISETAQQWKHIGTIILNKNKWELTKNNAYTGQSFLLKSGEIIYISGPIELDGQHGIYYTRSSGKESIGYYICPDNEDWIQTDSAWFAPTYLWETDVLRIYQLNEDLYELMGDEMVSDGIPEDMIRSRTSLLCSFYIDSNHKWILTQDSSNYDPQAYQVCSVEDGGSFILKNGDTLYINKQNGLLTHGPYGDEECYGIELTLESGHEFIAVLLMPSQLNSWNQQQSSIYGTFFDINSEYEEGNIIKLYDLDACNSYEDLPSYHYENEWIELSGITCNAVLVLQDEQWVLTNEPKYVGYNVILNSGETIFISGLSSEDGIGIYFVISSGRANTALYYSNDREDYIFESSLGWFSPTIPAEGDMIDIFVYEEGDDYMQAEDDYSFSHLEEIASHLCCIKMQNNEWTVIEDNS